MNRKTQTLTVNFRNPNVSLSAEKLEEGDFENAAVFTGQNSSHIRMNRTKLEATGILKRSNGSNSADKRLSCVTKSFPLIAAGWGILSLLIGLRVYFTVIMTENNRKLTAEIQQLRKSVSVTQAQWSVDTYCPKTGKNGSKGRQCKACQKEWHHFQSSCYAFYNIDGPHQINWEEAQNNCTAQNADLVVIGSPMEQEFISNHSGSSWRSSGYWIGLMVETGSWKWVDGGDLTADYWIQQPDGNAHCAISVRENSPMGWRALNCNSINRWICERAALSI